ncbi:MAG: hypothetical protein AAGU10_03760 [Methanosarcina mazei]
MSKIKKDSKSRFNGKKPFDVVRAEDFGGDLYEFYEPFEKLIRMGSGVSITGSRPVFLVGGRGTGKTMVLKFLSLEMQLKDFIKNELASDKSIEKLDKSKVKLFLDHKEFIGVYLRFKTTEYDSIKEDTAHLFKPYLSLKIAEQIFESLKLFRFFDLLSNNDESKIVTFFINQIDESITLEHNFDGVLEYIREDILRKLEVILELSSYYSLEEIKENNTVPIILSKKIIFDFADFLFSELDILRGKFLYVILDELEYLNDYQKGCIGELIKDCDETSVIFKIGTRYMPKVLPVGQGSEVLQESHDYLKINITDALNFANNSDGYKDLVKNILNKRLEKSKDFKSAGINNIELLFPNRSIEEEALELVGNKTKHWEKFRTYLGNTTNLSTSEIEKIIGYLSYPENPLIEKLNMLLYYRGSPPLDINEMYKRYLLKENKQYSDLYQKNAFNLLFQLYNDYRIDKKYDGIDTFISLSSGIIRNVILLCNEALNTASNYGYIPNKSEPVGVVYQDFGAKNYSKLQYESITQIPDNKGLKVQSFVNEIGTILRELHLDQNLVEPEPTHFETIYSELSEEAKDIFDAALNYSFIQKKNSMATKNKNEAKKDDFLINRIFAPHFKISYRLRGRTYIDPNRISSLILENNEKKKLIRKDIVQQNSKISVSNKTIQFKLGDFL